MVPEEYVAVGQAAVVEQATPGAAPGMDVCGCDRDCQFCSYDSQELGPFGLRRPEVH